MLTKDQLHTIDDLFRYFTAHRPAPDPPRGLKVINGNTLTWEVPTNLAGVTHYRVYLNTDAPEGLQYEVSVGQTQVWVPQAENALVSSYNKPMGAESILVRLEAGSPGGAPILPPSGGGGGPIGDQPIQVAYEKL